MYQSFRHGFATNSSSCHSIILAPKGPSPHWTNSDLTTGEHLENVTLMSAENKAIALARCLEYGKYNAHDTLKLRTAFAKHGQQAAFDNKGKGSFPLNSRMFNPPKGVKLESWVDMILDPDTSIHVHSDENTTFSPKSPLYEMGDRADMSLLTNADMDNWKFKQDGQAIVGFHQKTGMKFRWSPTPYTKSTVPELVDVKIR